MPLIFERTREEIQADIISELTSNTNITRLTPGSKAKTLVQLFSTKLNRAYQDFDVNFLKSFLPFAQGRFLDYIGDMVNVPRLGALTSSTTAASQLVKFYVESGTFGDLNSGASIFIPAGTQISTLPNNDGIIYRLIEGVVLSATSSEQFVSVEAIKDGSVSNLGPDALKFTTFNNYTTATGLLVTNTGILNTGRNIESDTNYRFRISNQAFSAEAANETAIRLALLVIPGVSNLVSIPFSRGIGTFDYLIQTIVPNTPQPVIDACQEAIARTQALGIIGRALRPSLTGMSFTISVTWRGDASTEDREQIKENINTAVQNYINNLSIGEEFIYNELIQRVMDVNDKIKNIGTSAQAFDLINIYRETKLRDNKIKEEITGDYTPEADERLIIEPSVETPVLINDKN